MNPEIIKICLNILKIIKSFETDGIPHFMLITILYNELCKPLYYFIFTYIIFNSTLLSGNIPKIVKKHIMTPILKR